MHYNLNKDERAKSSTFFLQHDNIKIGKDIYNFLKEQLKSEVISRVCLHNNPNELTQMMIIAISPQAKIAFHKNVCKDKIYQVIEGELIFEVLYKEPITLSIGEIFILYKEQFAKMYTNSKICIYQEIIAGPFKIEDTIYE